MCFCVIKRKTIVTKAKIWKYVNTIMSIIFQKKIHKIIMTSTMILWYWQYFNKIRKVKMKGIFFHRFDIAVHAGPWELKNTLMCQLWHVGRMRGKNLLKFYGRVKLLFLSLDWKSPTPWALLTPATSWMNHRLAIKQSKIKT